MSVPKEWLERAKNKTWFYENFRTWADFRLSKKHLNYIIQITIKEN